MNDKVGQIKKFWVALKFELKFEIFDLSGPGNDEIWQNQEIFTHIEILAQIWDIWPPQPANNEIWPNQDILSCI